MRRSSSHYMRLSATLLFLFFVAGGLTPNVAQPFVQPFVQPFAPLQTSTTALLASEQFKEQRISSAASTTNIELIEFPQLVCNSPMTRNFTFFITDAVTGRQISGTVDSIRIQGQDAADFTLQGVRVPGTAPFPFAIQFFPREPLRAGARAAELVVISRDSAGRALPPRIVPIVGDKQIYEFQLLQNLLFIDDVAPFQTLDTTVTLIRNAGTLPLPWTGATTIQGANSTLRIEILPNPTPTTGTLTSAIRFQFSGAPAGTTNTFDFAPRNLQCNTSQRFSFTVRVRPNPPTLTTQSVNGNPISAVAMGGFLCETLPKDTTIQVYNSGQLPLVISRASISPNSDFQLVNPVITDATPLVVPFLTSATLTLRYTPRQTGQQQATLTLFSTNATNLPTGSTTLTLTAVKDSAALAFSATLVDFGTVEQNQNAAPRTLTIRNIGTVAQQWALPVRAGNFVIESIAPIPTRPGDSSVATVRFTNTSAPGVFTNTAVLQDQCGRQYSLTFRITVQQPRPGIGVRNPFGISIAPCRTDTLVRLPITNVGPAIAQDLTIRNVTVMGLNASEFQVFLSQPLPFRIPATRTDSSIQIRFTPTPGATGRRQAVLMIESDAESAPNFPLTLEATKDSLNFVVSRSGVQFINIFPNTVVSDTLTITNTGTIPLQWGNNAQLSNSSNRFSLTITPSVTPPGGTSRVLVQFTGSTVSDSTIITFSTLVNGCLVQRVATARATILPPRISASASVPFGRLFCEPFLTSTVQVTNSGGQDLVLSSATFAANNGFTIEQPSPTLPVTISRGQTVNFTVRFTPQTATGTISNSITFRSNAANGATTTTVSVQRDVLDFRLSRSFINLSPNAELPPNTPATDTLRVFNTGNVPISWNVNSMTPQLFGMGANRLFSVQRIEPPTTPVGGFSVITVRFEGAPATRADGNSYLADTSFVKACNNEPPVPLTLSANVATATALIQIDTASAAPGDSLRIPVYLRNARFLREAGVQRFDLTLRYNATLLFPLAAAGQRGSVVRLERLLPLQLPISALTIAANRDTILARVPFVAMLGNTHATLLVLDSVRAVGMPQTVVRVSKRDGGFRLAELCEAGGTRLYFPAAQSLLAQNMPNPAVGSTLIQFTVPQAGWTTLRIASVLGSEVARVVDEYLEAGTYTITVKTSEVPNGVYFYTLKTGNQLETKRMEIAR